MLNANFIYYDTRGTRNIRSYLGDDDFNELFGFEKDEGNDFV